jgi:hypothetical protein
MHLFEWGQDFTFIKDVRRGLLFYERSKQWY